MADGSVYRRKDGRWAGEVSIGGKRRYVYGRSRRAARDQLTQLIAQGNDQARQRGTVAGVLARYLSDVRHTHAPRTWERYEGLARLYIVPAIGHIRLDRLTVNDCADLQSALLAAGLAPRSVKLCMGLLRSVLGPGSVAHAVRPPRLQPPRNRALSLDEARRLLAACRDGRERLLLWLTLGLGLRLGEACGLRDEDIQDTVINVRRQLQRIPHRGGNHPYDIRPPKHDGGRILPLVYPLKELIEERVREDHAGFLLGHAGAVLSPRTAQYLLQRLAQRAGVGAVRLHDLRHSANTFLAAAGVDAKTRMLLLGHRSVQVHAGYTHPDEAMLREAVERLGSALDVG